MHTFVTAPTRPDSSMPPSRLMSLLQAFVCAGLISMIGGCDNVRPVVPLNEWPARKAALQAKSTDDLERGNLALAAHLKQQMDDYRNRRRSTPPVLNYLALSGGADFGAFGAGVLVGWGQVSDPTQSRPDFDIVTGISTGAFIAPYAFVDTDAACMTADRIFRNPQKDWAVLRDIFFWLPGRSAFLDVSGLETDLSRRLDDHFLKQIAEKASQGQILSVAATNLDLAEGQSWDLGYEATEGPSADERGQIVKHIMASGAVPGLFPPVDIDHSLYVDGALSENLVYRMEPTDPHNFVSVWKRAYPQTPPPLIRVWVIVNNQLAAQPETVQPTWTKVSMSGIETALRVSTAQQIQVVAAEMALLNLTGQARYELRMIAIPSEWRPPVKGIMKKETMNNLADIGRKMGRDPASWQLLTAPTAMQKR